MKHHTDYLYFETPEPARLHQHHGPRRGLRRASRASSTASCLVNPMHITAAVYVNDAENGLIQDIDDWLERLAPPSPCRATATTAARPTPTRT